MAKKIPVYSIEAFRKSIFNNNFYCSEFNSHVREHQFTALPHKHDFYLTVIITGGKGWHEIDFERYHVKRGTIFLMKPGQMHYWKLSPHIEGFVFFHSGNFYNQSNTALPIEELHFFKSFQAKPLVTVSKKRLHWLSHRAEELLHEYKAPSKFSTEKTNALLKLIYIELLQEYAIEEEFQPKSYLSTLTAFEQLIEKQYMRTKAASVYAGQLNVSLKHLNRISKTCINKTATQVITDRVILEAKRLLLQSSANVNETAAALGYDNPSYFIRLFKKHSGCTPLAFIKQQTK